MDALHVFRADLSGLLHREAALRARAGAAACGADLRSADLLAGLADDAHHLAPAVFDRWAGDLRGSAGSGSFSPAAIALLRSVGVHVCPGSADALVAWMGEQLQPPSPMAGPSASTAPTSGEQGPLPLRMVAGAAIVLPLLALCHLVTGGRMVHERHLAAKGVALVATVLTTEVIAGTRSSGLYRRVVLRYAAGANTCQGSAEVRSDRAPSPGDLVTIVPAGPGCTEFRMPATLDDPRPQFVAATAFMATGLLALQGWRVMSRRRAPTWRRAATPASRAA